ncbi:MAG TPA: hypothetical protein VGR46_11865 [Candidatus Limnocylindria bacterium]|jgi:DNA-binding beta-propeller fold protein YncE|nr:hypothetical protein [Candidatus Limnocylindria bacterium]
MTLRAAGFTPVPPGAKPGFDHADTYLAPNAATRVYVAHTGADRVDVLDCATGAYLRAIPDLPGVAGVLVESARDLLITSDRAAARLSVFRASDETLLMRVPVDPRPNGLAFDDLMRTIFSFNLGEPIGTNYTASVVALDDPRVVATIRLPGRPRWAVFDDPSRAVYANIADPPLILVIDADRRQVRREIPVPAAGPHGLAIVPEEQGASLWCAADAGMLIILDRDSGRTIASLPLPGTPDVVMYDRALARLYVAVGMPGTVSAFDTVAMRELETVVTEEGAHTIGWDPRTRRLFVFQPASCGVAIFEEG